MGIPNFELGQNTENALCPEWDLISQPSGYLKLPGSPGTTQLHQLCAVRALGMPCTPLPLFASLAASLWQHTMHTLFSLNMCLCVSASLGTPVECHVLGQNWGIFCPPHAGWSLPLSGYLLPPIWAPARPTLTCAWYHLRCHACPGLLLCGSNLHTCSYAQDTHLCCIGTLRHTHTQTIPQNVFTAALQRRSISAPGYSPRGIPSCGGNSILLGSHHGCN